MKVADALASNRFQAISNHHNDFIQFDLTESNRVEVETIWKNYRKTSNIRGTPVGNTIVDHSDVVGASPVGAAPTTSSLST